MASPPLRTFCVIPHIIRDDPSFDAVHEDHIVFDAQQKLTTFDFTSVLSPAHNLPQNILGPLLDSLRNRQNAALLVFSPCGSSEGSTTAMDLFSNVLPLLFRALPACSIAHLSVVEVKRGGKSVTDLYRMVPVNSLQEVETEEVLRASAGAAWGTVMEIFAQRGPSARFDEASNSDIPVVLAQVEMDGYGTFLVGDMGSSTDTLSNVTMTLRSAEGFGSSRTVPPRMHLTKILQPCVAPLGLSHVVVIPDPGRSQSQTLRLFHFASTLEREAVSLIGRSSNASSPGGSHVGTPSSSVIYAEGVDAPDIHDSGNDVTSANAKFTSGAPHHNKATVTTSAAHKQPVSWRDDIVNSLLAPSVGNAASLSRGAGTHGRPTDHLVTSPAPLPMGGSAVRSSGANRAAPVSSHAGSMVVLTPSKREQQLSEKLIVLDRTIKDQKQHILALQSELHRLQTEVETARSDAQQKADDATASQAAAEKAQREQKEAAELVSKLLKRVSDMDHRHDADEGNSHGLRARNEDLLAMNASLQEQLNRTIGKLKNLEKKELSRLRENTLSNIVQSPARGRNVNGTTTPTRAKSQQSHRNRGGDHVLSDGEALMADSDALLQNAKQLRARCAKLETENHELRIKHQQEEAMKNAIAIVERGLRNSAASPTSKAASPLRSGDGSSVGPTAGGGKVSSYLEKEYALLKHQAQFFADEVSRIQKDKDELQRLLATHPRSVDISETVRAVGHAIMNGCSSLLVQLQVIDSAKDDLANVRRVRAKPQQYAAMAEQQKTSQTSQLQASSSNALVGQHAHALTSLKHAIEEILQRRCTLSQGGIPSTATAADCDALSHFLTFEVERLTHLRAFLPTFAQLAVAVEHIKLRSAQPTHSSAPASATKVSPLSPTKRR